MKRIVILTGFLISLTLSYGQELDTIIKSVHIGFHYSLSIFPENWQPSPINAYGEQLDAAEVARSKQIVAKGLHKYPDVTLENLAAVYFLRQMKFYDVSYGGTNSENAVYLVNQGRALGYTNKYLEQTFHHEFSSILLRKYPSLLDTQLWKKANDASFVYNDPENGVGAIRNNKSSQDLDSTLCEKGILTQYGGSSIENDINTFAQNLFCPDRYFWSYYERYPRIKQKVLLLIRFYNGLHPVFTEQYFKKLSTP